jgi:hypothetical protein
VTGAGVVERPRLHLPDEPFGHREAWWSAVLDGTAYDEVLAEVATWLWARWRIVEQAGIDRPAFDAVVAGYRRELWLWLAGERTWEQCCSGLVGRIGRRFPT